MDTLEPSISAPQLLEDDASVAFPKVFKPTIHKEIYSFEDLPRCFEEMHKNTQTGIPIIRMAKELPASVSKLA